MNNDFVEGMRAAGKLAGLTLLHLQQMVQPGITTNQLDQAAFDYISSHGATPAPLGYKGYPKSICTSVNDIICHGVPNDTPLKEGDYINIDVTVLLNGYHGDTSRSMIVGMPDCPLIGAAHKAMNAGLWELKPGCTMGDIGFAINKSVTRSGFWVVKEIGGHGINTIFHDAPWVPSYGKKGRGEVLTPGMCITIEPLIIEFDRPLESIEIPNSEIQEYRAGGARSAQFEHTVLITEDGMEVLTAVLKQELEAPTGLEPVLTD